MFIVRVRAQPIIAYDWNTLPQNALVVDVGGGIGSASLVLAKEFSNLRIAIQDRQSAVENGVEVHLPCVNQRLPVVHQRIVDLVRKTARCIVFWSSSVPR